MLVSFVDGESHESLVSAVLSVKTEEGLWQDVSKRYSTSGAAMPDRLQHPWCAIVCHQSNFEVDIKLVPIVISLLWAMVELEEQENENGEEEQDK